jgi:ectoine hydroxylase-related dioxygenase (phytanoyl-CoA dioxygenase family)
MPVVRAPEVVASALLGEKPDEAAIEAYQRVGAIIVRKLIDPGWIAALRACYAPLAQTATVPFIKGEPPPDMRKLTQRAGMWEEEERFRAFLFDSPIARAAARLMRSKVAQLYEDILITEPAGGRAMTSWHQDEPTWPVSGRQLSSVWLSLETVTPETGGMRFVEGTHQGPMYHPSFIKADEAVDSRFWTGGAFPDIDAQGDAPTIAQTDTEPGDVVVFHPRAIHTSFGSSKNHTRRTFTIRFMGDDIRWLPKKRIYHRWMHDLGLKEGDRIVTPRMPVVWDAANAPAARA